MKTVFNKMSAQGWQRLQRGVPSGGMGYLRTWMRTDVRRVAARRCRLLRYLVTVVAAVGMLAIAAHSDVLKPVSHPTHQAHTVVSSAGGEFKITLDHAHIDSGQSGAHHEAFPTAMLTKSSFTVSLVASGLMAVLVVAANSLTSLRVSPGRGPPGGLAGARTGRELLTRFCLSRR